MSAEWKPGDVALLLDEFGESEIGVCYEAGTGTSGHHAERARWTTQSGEQVWSSVMRIRPLVVIDPEDAEQVERLAKVYLDAIPAGLSGTAAELMRTALREFARPTPRIEEPTLVGALVIDDDSEWWVRRHSGHWECLAGPPGADVRPWAALNNDYGPLRVLSPGVTP